MSIDYRYLQKHEHWILQNSRLLSRRFGKYNVAINKKSLQSIKIMSFRLPSNWKQIYTELLIVLPKGSQIFYSPPERFYLNWGLRAINGRVPGHYFENHSFNDLAEKYLARFSFHINEGWNPNMKCEKGVNLLHVLDGLYKGMEAGANEVLS